MIKRIKQSVTWLAVQIVMATLLWFGFEEGVQGAKNCGLFMVWALALLSFFSLSESAITTFRKGPPSLIPRWFSTAFALVLIGFLVWEGALAAGIAYLIGLCINSAGRHKARELGPLEAKA